MKPQPPVQPTEVGVTWLKTCIELFPKFFYNFREMELARKKLKLFLEEYLPDFYEMKKVGFFKKGIRKTDYEKIAQRYCDRLGYKSIYEYRLVCHGSMCDGKKCDRSNPNCPNYPRGKYRPQKWKPLKPIEESELYFNEVYTN